MFYFFKPLILFFMTFIYLVFLTFILEINQLYLISFMLFWGFGVMLLIWVFNIAFFKGKGLINLSMVSFFSFILFKEEILKEMVFFSNWFTISSSFPLIFFIIILEILMILS